MRMPLSAPPPEGGPFCVPTHRQDARPLHMGTPSYDGGNKVPLTPEPSPRGKPTAECKGTPPIHFQNEDTL